MSEASHSKSGIDRRSALKKAAVAGAVAWSAPTVLSSRVQAVDFVPGTTCTAKCSPTGEVGIVGTAVGCGCGPGAPGGQPVTGRITGGPTVVSTLTCSCGGTAKALLCTPSSGDCFEVREKPGNINLPGDSVFPVSVYVSCVDRSGDTVWKFYRTVAGASIKPGSCQGTDGQTFTWVATLSVPCAEGCGVPSCATLPC